MANGPETGIWEGSWWIVWMNKSWRSAWCKKAELSDHADSDTTEEAGLDRPCTAALGATPALLAFPSATTNYRLPTWVRNPALLNFAPNEGSVRSRVR